MKALYNEIDQYCCAWLSNLMDAGLITPGKIDNRSITELTPDDVKGYERVHFFAGIAGWDYALNLAGWGEEPVWTGSCPCQPFSVAGRRKGTEDERHLWPIFYQLISVAKPPVVFGEQVASKDGRDWLAGVRTDLEALAYVVGAADLCAAGINAPHIRQRLWWVADAGCERTRRGICRSYKSVEEAEIRPSNQLGRPGSSSWLGNSHVAGSQGRSEHSRKYANQRTPWTPSELVFCADGKARRIEPGTFPLANGVPARMGKLRAYGNAIVPQVAAEVISAYMEAREMDRELLAA